MTDGDFTLWTADLETQRKNVVVPVTSITHIFVGKTALAFDEGAEEARENCCFSTKTMYTQLNLEAKNRHIRDTWLARLTELAPHAKMCTGDLLVDGTEFVQFTDSRQAIHITLAVNTESGTTDFVCLQFFLKGTLVWL